MSGDIIWHNWKWVVYYFQLCHIMSPIIRIIFLIIFPIIFLLAIFFELCHYYFNYFYYFRLCHGFASQFREAGRRQFSSYALSYDCQVSLGPNEASWWAGDLALSSQVNIWSWKTTIIRIVLISYLFFSLFDQDWAAHNLSLCTAGQHVSNLWEASCHCIKKKALIAGTWAQFMPFSFVFLHYVTIISYYTYYFKN